MRIAGHEHRLHRYPDEGPIAGVCAGVADYFNVDPTVVRIAAIVLACMGPGIPAYIIAWIFVPEADGTTVAPSLHRGHGGHAPGHGQGHRGGGSRWGTPRWRSTRCLGAEFCGSTAIVSAMRQ